MKEECAVFLFNEDSYDLEKVKSYSFEQCTSYEEPWSPEEFDEMYNNEDNGDWITEYYIRIFPFGKKYLVYMITEDVSCPAVYTDGTPCCLDGLVLRFDDDEHEDVWLSDIPVQILDDLCERTSFVKKVSVEEFEELHNNQEWPLYVTLRKVD